jgi:hypothetical protein
MLRHLVHDPEPVVPHTIHVAVMKDNRVSNCEVLCVTSEGSPRAKRPLNETRRIFALLDRKDNGLDIVTQEVPTRHCVCNFHAPTADPRVYSVFGFSRVYARLSGAPGATVARVVRGGVANPGSGSSSGLGDTSSHTSQLHFFTCSRQKLSP